MIGDTLQIILIMVLATIPGFLVYCIIETWASVRRIEKKLK